MIKRIAPLVTLFLGTALPALAQSTPPVTPAASAARTTNTGSRSRYGLIDPIGNLEVPELIGRLVKFATGVVGALFLLTFVYAGFLWMTANGDKKNVEKAQQLLSNALIGFTIVVTSYLLVSITMGYLSSVQGT